ncbi:MAG: GTP-binding protein, partial [Ruminococcus sp.]|nr:GTP-binding protein [Ruminococcus sp.]
MAEPSHNQSKRRVCAALLAHVDAGKTTLSEGLLYVSGAIRRLGRVDKRDAFLDTSPLERERGITIFSKQAVLGLEEMEATLLDTPGHVDFSAEMERTLQVLDAAILVISGADGVQGHTQTLWKLLSRYQVPVFVFVNKMDQEGTDAGKLLEELKKRLDENCVDFSACPKTRKESHDEKAAGIDGAGEASDGDLEAFYENIAMCGETVLDAFLEQGTVADEEIRKLILERKCFPCFFGSALKLTGVEEFLRGFERYVPVRSYPDTFGAKVYKISRDDQGNRLTYLKVTGGSLRVKDLLTNRSTAAPDRPNREKKPKETAEAYPEAAGPAEETGFWEEKVNQIRIYSGAKYEAAEEVQAGTVCAVTGLTKTYPGEGLGIEAESGMPILEPVLTYQIQLPPGCDVHVMLKNLRQLEEEEPMLHIAWNEALGEIHAQLMGEVQIEILK